MNAPNGWRTRLAGSYWTWRAYHALVADAMAIQRPTKFRIVYDLLGRDLGIAADIGCGPGVFTRYLCTHAKRVWAADIDRDSLARVRSRHASARNLSCLVTEAGRLPFGDGTLDTILYLEILEHLKDDAGAAREVWRVLRPGGRLVLSVPVPPGEIDDEQTNPWGHKREGYQWQEIRALLEGSGFRIEKHRFAMFRFSRLGEGLVRRWRRRLHLPAPIFFAWLGYLDFLLGEKGRQEGGYLPANIVILATKLGSPSPHLGTMKLAERDLS
jgi:SAM-dependent methyltransferase